MKKMIDDSMINYFVMTRFILDARRMLKNKPPYANSLTFIYTKHSTLKPEYIIKNYIRDMRDMRDGKIEYFRTW